VVVVDKFPNQKILIDVKKCRKELPVKRPDVPIPLWNIIKKLIGKDLTKVSMPVSLNEPLTALQRVCEAMTLKIDLFQKAANTEDPVLRLTYAFIAFNTIYSIVKLRKRKPFNPMLGETYEFVTDKIKYVSEKVQH